MIEHIRPAGKRNKRTKREEINMPMTTEQQGAIEMPGELQFQVCVKQGSTMPGAAILRIEGYNPEAVGA
jgi:hypothetical protein